MGIGAKMQANAMVWSAEIKMTSMPRSTISLETLLRILLWSGALPLPCPQYVVADEDGGFCARVDFCWPAATLIVEADGFAYHSDRSAYRRDCQRLTALIALIAHRKCRFVQGRHART